MALNFGGGMAGLGVFPGYIQQAKKAAGLVGRRGGKAVVTHDPWAGVIAQAKAQLAAASRATVAKDPMLQAWALQRKQLAAENAAEQVRLNKQANRAQGFAEALYKLSSHDDDQIGAQYRRAAETIQGLGTGLTGSVAEAQQAEANKTADAVNAMFGPNHPAGGNIQGYNVDALRNAMQVSGVMMPATNFAQEGARAAAEAQMRAREGVWNVETIAQGYLQKAADAKTQSGLDVKKLLATRPELVAKVAASLNTNKTQAATFLATLINQRETARRQAKSAQDYADWLNTRGDVAVAGAVTDTTEAVNKHDEAIAKQTARNAKDLADIKAARGRLAAQYTSTLHVRSNWKGEPIPGPDGKVQPVAGWHLDPKTNRVTADVKPGTTKPPAAVKPPSYDDINQVQTSMSEGIRAKLKLDKTFVSEKEKASLLWPRKRIAVWLMNNYGKSFLARYPNQKKVVQQMVDTLAASIYADLLARKKTK